MVTATTVPLGTGLQRATSPHPALHSPPGELQGKPSIIWGSLSGLVSKQPLGWADIPAHLSQPLYSCFLRLLG